MAALPEVVVKVVASMVSNFMILDRRHEAEIIINPNLLANLHE
jgi:hypothetical protein